MRLARIQTPDGPRGVVAREGRWLVVEDIFANPLVPTGESHPLEGAKLLAPVEPRVVLGMAHNGEPGDREIPRQAFMKSARTVVGPGDEIELDTRLGAVNGEGELVLVVGRRTRRITADEARAHVLGWTIGNDVTNLEQADEKATQVKNGDGYTPLGPWIETELPDALDLTMTMERNGEPVAEARTSQLAWNPFEVLEYLSQYLTLDAGDVVLTGAPGTSFQILPGDECRCLLEGIGELVNPVVGVRHE
ncbi:MULTISPECIES: fumarylacetoacetate hydrolase family protein [unclassified Luteococcus]|uniref:fumarylacetoacetate hydrolase family protein n=1 Tax=unclassified Luteococcus TaxID=2639923 RepID=UPI00313F29E5